ncbi:MAG: hypothetical protein HY862_09255 [Chloroflexi bacterium]|nr:hypothetical protein [Chloroflexota bacterium]
MDIDGFPIGTFLFLALAAIGLGIGISLLIMARISDDKNTSIIKQVWNTFFGKPTPPHDDLGKHE